MRMRTLLTSLATVVAVTGGLALTAPVASGSTGAAHVVAAPLADPSVAPGGNFDLGVWQDRKSVV